jgi:hypothetical protein
MSWKMTGKVKPLTHGISGEQLLPSEKLILLILADYYNDEQGYAWVSQGRLAKEGLCSVRNLYRLLESLETVHKIVSIEKRKQGETDLYRFDVRTITDILAQDKSENVRNSTDISVPEKAENVRTITDIAVSTKQVVEPKERYLAGRDETPTEEDSPSKERENPQASYRAAKSIYRRHCKGNLGNLGEKQGEAWVSLLRQYGEKKVLGALEIWARELREPKKWDYPIALFLKDPDEFIEAYEFELAPAPEEEEKDEDRMLTAKDVIREREERERESRGR